MGRDDPREGNFLDAASDYISGSDLIGGEYYSPEAMGSTLRPGEFVPDSTLRTTDSQFYSPQESPFDDQVYKARGRNSPTRRDQNARQSSPGPQKPSCICEMCECGKHACPVHGAGAKKAVRKGRFEGQGSYARDYAAPPVEALTAAFSNVKEDKRGERPSGPPKPKGIRPKFEGNSSYQRDYTPPPREAMKQQPGSRDEDSGKKLPRSRPPFEGQSGYNRDYLAPPIEAFRKEAPPPQPT